MTLHKHIQGIFVATRELLEVADAISTMRDSSKYGDYPFSTKPDRHVGDLLNEVVLRRSGRSYADSKLATWEGSVRADERRIVRLLFADYVAKKTALLVLLDADLVELVN